MQAKRYQSQREIRQWHAFSGCLWGRVPYVAFTVCSEARRSCTWGTRAAESHRFLQAAKMFFFWVYTWKDWCWSWNSNTLATWCDELTHWRRPWCWERLKAGGEGDDRGWDGCMASPTRWTWVWVSSGTWWWTGRPGVLPSMGSQRVRHDWATELNSFSIIDSSVVMYLYASSE